MKKLIDILILTLAMNFLVLAGGIGWLYSNGNIDREKVQSVKEILFPSTQPVASATTKPSGDEATTQPLLRLDELLAKQAGRSASQQVEFIQQSFDEQMAQLDRRQRELIALQNQVEAAKRQMARDRAALDEERRKLDAAQQAATALSTDKGFQDALQVYNAMSSKQVKSIFMTLDEQTVTRLLQAMQPRAAARIIKEFKTPEEVDKIQRILERLRQPQASTKG